MHQDQSEFYGIVAQMDIELVIPLLRNKRTVLFSVEFLIGIQNECRCSALTIKIIICTLFSVSFSGAAALFFGISFMSIAEFFYLAIRHYMNIYSQ